VHDYHHSKTTASAAQALVGIIITGLPVKLSCLLEARFLGDQGEGRTDSAGRADRVATVLGEMARIDDEYILSGMKPGLGGLAPTHRPGLSNMTVSSNLVINKDDIV
jgi:hypothetical protein